MRENALHYLKEYRSEKAMWESDRKGHLDWIEQYKESREKHQQAVIELKHKENEVNEILTDYVALKQYWAEQQENPPLTWGELKAMLGKPVWVETKKFGSHWYLFEIDDIKIMCVGRYGEHIQLFRFEMNKGDWHAYRKERE